MGETSARGCCNRRCSCNFGETTARRSSNGTVSSFRKSYEVVDVFEHRDDVNDGNGGGDGDEEEGKAKPSANLENLPHFGSRPVRWAVCHAVVHAAPDPRWIIIPHNYSVDARVRERREIKSA